MTNTGSEEKVLLNRQITVRNNLVNTGCDVKLEEQKAAAYYERLRPSLSLVFGLLKKKERKKHFKLRL